MDSLILSPENQSDIQKAGELLRNGELVVIPTETVYGLAANALDSNAVKKIYEAKGRPSDNPLIVHVSDFIEIEELVEFIPEKARVLAEKFWPGPLTMVMPKSSKIPDITSGGLDSVAIRIPKSRTARDIIKAAKRPLAAPSANISGKPSPTEFSHVFSDMNGRVSAIFSGKNCSVGLESTVISLCTDIPTVLRPGGISVEEIRLCIGEVLVDKSVDSHTDELESVSSPGMKYKHYSPKAKVVMSKLSFFDYVNLFENESQVAALCFEGEEKYIKGDAITFGKRYDSNLQAKELFNALHKIDELGYKKVYARAPQKNGMGLAVYNRLIRACGFNVIEPTVKIVGLTGQSGAGKTSVANELFNYGIPSVDCDKISRDPKTYEGDCLRELVKTFGNTIMKEDKLDRKELAKIAFSSKENTKKLNQITFPVIKKRVSDEIDRLKKSGVKILVLDAPTLFEAEADNYCTHILSVTANENLCLQRIIDRDKISVEEAKKRMSSQLDELYYVNCSDFVIDTSQNEFKAQGREFTRYINNN